MIVLVTILLITSLVGIFFQDIKERQVYWWLFPLVGILFGLLALLEVDKALFTYMILINLSIVSLILLILFIYIKLILKRSFLDTTFGLGDVLIFCALCFSFPTISFIILFSSSLLFSLVIHFILVKRLANKTVPLAGYMAIFFAFVMMFNLVGLIDNLYIV